MKKQLFSILLLLTLTSVCVNGQPKKKFIKVNKSEKEKIISGFLVGVTDSTLIVKKRSEVYEVVTIDVKDIYSYKLGKPFGRGMLTGALIGIPVGLLYGAMAAAAAETTSVLVTALSGAEPEVNTGSYILGGMLGGALIGAGTGLVVDLVRIKKPIIIDYSKDNFTKSIPSLRYYLGNMQ
jgi:hypothetical protein